VRDFFLASAGGGGPVNLVLLGMLNMTRYIAALAFVLICADALASGETLSFRVNDAGQVEAVISGTTGFCGRHFEPNPSTINIVGNLISINTVVGGDPGGCLEPLPPPRRYEVALVLGALPHQTFNVVWTTSGIGSLTRVTFLSAVLVVDALLPPGVPTMSIEFLIASVLLLLISGACLTTRSTGPAGTGFYLASVGGGGPVNLVLLAVFPEYA
jgi:hypothetical protein